MACNRYCVTYYPEDLPVDLYVRYSRCIDGVTVTELISGLITTDNGNGTYTACLCTNTEGGYPVPTCVQNEIEILCPVDIQWVLDNSEICVEVEPTQTPTPTATTPSEPTPCGECLCKQITSLRGDDCTFSYYDCYGVFQTSGLLPANGTVYVCICGDNQTIEFNCALGGSNDIFIYPNGGCADYQNCDSEVTQTPTPTSTTTPTLTATQTPTSTSTSTPTNTPTQGATQTPTSTPTETPTNTPTVTSTSTPTQEATSTPTSTPTNTPTSTTTPTLTSTSAGTCVPDTVTPKGTLIRFNSSSDYTNCSVYTGTSSTVITGATPFTSITGGTINITGITPTLLEIYVKIVCIGCCEQVFRVNLDECCGYEPPLTATPTPTSTSTSTPTSTPTNTPTNTPSTATCPCNTYSVEFTQNCGEGITWTDCDSGEPMFGVRSDFLGGGNSTFLSGDTIQICSCSIPVPGCPASGSTITLVGSGCIPAPTQTPTPTKPATLYYRVSEVIDPDLCDVSTESIYVTFNNNNPIFLGFTPTIGDYVTLSGSGYLGCWQVMEEVPVTATSTTIIGINYGNCSCVT